MSTETQSELTQLRQDANGCHRTLQVGLVLSAGILKFRLYQIEIRWGTIAELRRIGSVRTKQDPFGHISAVIKDRFHHISTDLIGSTRIHQMGCI